MNYKKEINRLLETLEALKPGTKEYSEVLKNLNDLGANQDFLADKKELHDLEVEAARLKAARQNELIKLGGKVTVTLLVLYFEKSNAVISKAFGFIKD